MSGYQGDFKLGDTLDVKFTTVNASGVPTTLIGSPVVAAYVGNSTTEITGGITLTVDFDGRTGYHNVRVVASTGNTFAAATNISLALTAGTVNGISVVGYEVGSFSIENRVQNIASVPVLTGAYPHLGIIDSGTCQASTSTTLQLRSGSPAFGTNTVAGATLLFQIAAGYWQERGVNSNTSGAGGTLTFDAASTAPTGTIPYILIGTAPLSSSTTLTGNMTQLDGSAAAAVSLRKILVGTAGETMTFSHVGNTTGSRTGSVSGSIGSVTTPVVVDSGSVTQIQSGVNVTSMNGVTVYGAGVLGNLWRGSP